MACAYDARQLLAADFLIVSAQPLPNLFVEQAQSSGLMVAQTVVFPSMVTAGVNSKLWSIKAVSPGYPLRGSLRIHSKGSSNTISTGPEQGSVWVDPAMLATLHAQEGDVMQIGRQSFVIDATLERELDRGAGFMNFAPRVMMSMADLSATGLIGIGSRVTYRVLLAGADEQIARYEAWAAGYMEINGLNGVRIETLKNAKPLMRKALERADRFLSLIALVTAMIAAVAIALSAYRYARKQVSVCAVLKCLGANSKTIEMN